MRTLLTAALAVCVLIAVAPSDARAVCSADVCAKEPITQTVRHYYDLNKNKADGGEDWLRVLIAFGVETSGTLTAFTAAEARTQEAIWDGWAPVRKELERLEAERARLE